MSSRLSRIVVVSVALVAFAGVAPATANPTANPTDNPIPPATARAQAAPAGSEPQGTGPRAWRRYHYTAFTDAAGAACPFRVRGEIVRQDVWYRTSDSYRNGDPKDQLFVGPLYVRYVNETNGKSLVASLSGSASIHYDPDGTQFWYAVGPFGLTIHPRDPYHLAGEYVIGGVTELEVHPGLVPQIRYHRGPIFNVCDRLG